MTTPSRLECAAERGPRRRPHARRGDGPPARRPRRRSAPPRQARRRAAVRLRRQQGPQARPRVRSRAVGGRRHAAHRGRRPIEPCARHRGRRRPARRALRPSSSAARGPIGRRPTRFSTACWGRRSNTCLHARSARPRCAPRRSAARPGPASVRDPPRRLDPAGRHRVRARAGRARRPGPAPDVIVHATSSGGTQAGLIAGAALLALPRASSESARTIRHGRWKGSWAISSRGSTPRWEPRAD